MSFREYSPVITKSAVIENCYIRCFVICGLLKKDIGQTANLCIASGKSCPAFPASTSQTRTLGLQPSYSSIAYWSSNKGSNSQGTYATLPTLAAPKVTKVIGCEVQQPSSQSVSEKLSMTAPSKMLSVSSAIVVSYMSVLLSGKQCSCHPDEEAQDPIYQRTPCTITRCSDRFGIFQTAKEIVNTLMKISLGTLPLLLLVLTLLTPFSQTL